jgi:hypothetical protein
MVYYDDEKMVALFPDLFGLMDLVYYPNVEKIQEKGFKVVKCPNNILKWIGCWKIQNKEIHILCEINTHSNISSMVVIPFSDIQKKIDEDPSFSARLPEPLKEHFHDQTKKLGSDFGFFED